jgi:hypothetical protein
MNRLIDLYLDRVLRVAELPDEQAAEVRDELKAAGLSDEEAAFKAIRLMGHPTVVGNRLTRPFRWIDIRSHGTARGVIAIGPRAVGVFAFGGLAVGVVAIGGISLGVVSMAGLGVGLLVWAGVALGLTATGGLAVGAVAAGGLAVGLIAAGGVAVGLKVAAGGQAFSHFTPGSEPPWLTNLEWLLKVPEFIMTNMPVILPAYLLVIAAGVGAQLWHTHKLNKEFDDWVFE